MRQGAVMVFGGVESSGALVRCLGVRRVARVGWYGIRADVGCRGLVGEVVAAFLSCTAAPRSIPSWFRLLHEQAFEAACAARHRLCCATVSPASTNARVGARV